ncbi:MAG: hypothetical protein P4L53_00780 [Candidatus Obscuribacterales bacterium]|nr:hypothetical protein [Candidatus Obscuribacterales bacterium]
MGTAKYLFSLALALSMVSSSLAPAIACGPFFDDADFSYDTNPDLPLKKFVAGRLGIIEPTFAKTYLVVAYRYLNGKPLSVTQQKAVMALLLNRLDVSGSRNNLTTASVPVSGTVDSALAIWKAAHNKVPGVTAVGDIDTNRQVAESPDGMGESYLNCSDDAFSNANTTLQERIAKHGLTSPFVKSWLTAQDSVFCHCGGNHYDWNTKKYGKEPAFPELSAKETDPEARFDRQYQIAAAHFYAQQFDAAFKEFSAIADDSKSPYAALSRYMTARCLVRKANLTKLDAAAKESAFESALSVLNEVYANTTAPYQAFHQPAQKLISLIDCTIHPDKQINTLGRLLASSDDDKGFQQNLDDYTILVHHAEGYTDDYYDTQSAKPTTPKTAVEDDLTNWITSYQLGNYAEPEKTFKKAEAQFEKTHSIAWLLVALTYAPFDKAKVSSLLAAANALPQTSPAYLSINYAVAKLLIGMHDVASANSLISSLETQAKNQQIPSSLNLLMDLRAKLPTHASGFIANAVRIPASYSINMDYFDVETSPSQEKPKKIAPAFALANADCMNKSMPVSLLANICSDAKLPSALKANLAQATFVRAVLLDDNEALKKSSEVLKQLSSQISALKSVKQLLPAVLATSGADQKFAAAYLMLHNPGMDPFVTAGAQRQDGLNELNEYNDNWWLTSSNSDTTISQTPGSMVFSKLPNFPDLLTATQKAQAAIENKKIAELGAGPTYLGSIVCNYAISHPSDSRVPEALALEVRASHYGNKDKSTTKYSKQAFELLHKKYPKSPFTARTPYHY